METYGAGATGGSVVGKTVATSMMMPLILLSTLFLLIGLIVLSTTKSKTSGSLLAGLGLVLGGAAFYTINKGH